MKFPQINTEQLRDDDAMEKLFHRAVKCDLVDDSECGRLRFWPAAEHARRVGKSPAGLFHWLVSSSRWDFLTCKDEDRGSRRLRAMRQPVADDHRQGQVRHISECLPADF